MQIQSGQLVALGYGTYVRSDDVVAVEPITADRGPGRRTRVWLRGLSDSLIASRAEGSIIDDLVTPADEAARMRAQRSVLRDVVALLDGVSPSMKRVIGEETGTDVDQLASDARHVLG